MHPFHSVPSLTPYSSTLSPDVETFANNLILVGYRVQAYPTP